MCPWLTALIVLRYAPDYGDFGAIMVMFPECASLLPGCACYACFMKHSARSQAGCGSSGMPRQKCSPEETKKIPGERSPDFIAFHPGYNLWSDGDGAVIRQRADKPPNRTGCRLTSCWHNSRHSALAPSNTMSPSFTRARERPVCGANCKARSTSARRRSSRKCRP